MDILEISKHYLNIDNRISYLLDKGTKEKSIVCLVVLSYFTILIPLIFSVVYFSLRDRVSKTLPSPKTVTKTTHLGNETLPSTDNFTIKRVTPASKPPVTPSNSKPPVTPSNSKPPVTPSKGGYSATPIKSGVNESFNYMESTPQSVKKSLNMNNSKVDLSPIAPISPLILAKDPIQIDESKKVKTYTGNLTPEEKKKLTVTYETGKLKVSFKDRLNVDFSIRCETLLDSKSQVIVNSANTQLGGSAGIDALIQSKGGALYKAAHKKLQTVYKSQYVEGHAAMIESGELAKLSIKDVIVVAGPKSAVDLKKNDKLYSCYYNSLALADSEGKTSIAFPCIAMHSFTEQEPAAPISIKAVFDFVKDYPGSFLRTISIHPIDQNAEEFFASYKNYLTNIQ